MTTEFSKTIKVKKNSKTIIKIMKTSEWFSHSIIQENILIIIFLINEGISYIKW